MSSICSNMTLDLLFYPGKKKTHRCHVIRFITFHSLLSLGDYVSLSHPASIPPPSTVEPEVPVSPLGSPILTDLSIPLFTIRSRIHWQLPIKEKSNQSTHLHNGRYEPGLLQRDIRTQREQRTKGLGVYFHISIATQKKENGSKGLKLLSFSLYQTIQL